MPAAAVRLQLPVAGCWSVLNPPGHGRWEFDLIGTAPDGKALRTHAWRAALGLADVATAHGWSRPVFAPFDGEVVAACAQTQDRSRISVLTDLVASFAVRPLRHRRTPLVLAGNYVVIATHGVAAFLAHLREDSLRVTVGERVRAGDPIGQVGHSGNTVMPHLHFHVVDGPDLLAARPVAFVVERYDIFREGRWQTRHDAPLPAERTRVRAHIAGSGASRDDRR